MAFSDAARDIIKNELDNRALRNSNSKNQVVYAVDVGLKDPARDGTIARAQFKFSKPVSKDLLDQKSSTMLNYLSKNLQLEGDIGTIDAILQSIVGGRRKVGKKRSTGSVSVMFGDADDMTGSSAAVTGVNGRFVSIANLKAILELVAKEYLIKDMKRAGAPLKYRTGRFANSLRIKDIVMPEGQNDTNRPPQLGVTYNYMIRPYSVFDPRVSTYRRLSLRPFAGARNPQRLIGEAIAKAARDLIHSRYRITVKQGT